MFYYYNHFSAFTSYFLQYFETIYQSLKTIDSTRLEMAASMVWQGAGYGVAMLRDTRDP